MSQQEQPLPLLEICKHLRNKKMSYMSLAEAIRPRSDRDENAIGNGAHSWCFHTQGPVGPDGERVTTEACGPARRCHCPL